MAGTVKTILTMALFAVVTVAIGSFVGYAAGSGGADPWYMALNKAPETPPGWVFPVAWTILYTLMGCAGGWLWAHSQRTALSLFFLQLAVNYAWSFVFFYFHQTTLAFVWIVALFIFAAAWVRSIWPLKPSLALIQGFYLMWLAFAGYLSWYIMRHN